MKASMSRRTDLPLGNSTFVSEKSAHVLAASVQRSARHEDAESVFAAKRARKDAIGEEMRSISGRASDPFDGQEVRSQLEKLQAESDNIVHALQPLRLNVLAGRQEHSARMRSAFQPLITAAATRSALASDALAEGLATLAQIDSELVRAGGTGLEIFAPDLTYLSGRLAKLAGRV